MVRSRRLVARVIRFFGLEWRPAGMEALRRAARHIADAFNWRTPRVFFYCKYKTVVLAALAVECQDVVLHAPSRGAAEAFARICATMMPNADAALRIEVDDERHMMALVVGNTREYHFDMRTFKEQLQDVACSGHVHIVFSRYENAGEVWRETILESDSRRDRTRLLRIAEKSIRLLCCDAHLQDIVAMLEQQ